MTPRLSGHFYQYLAWFFFVLKLVLGIVRQYGLEKFAILSLEPWNHGRILIYRTWTIGHCQFTRHIRVSGHHQCLLIPAVFIKIYRPFLHYAPVSKHKEMRTRLGWTVSHKSLYFAHQSLELVPLFTGMRERSITLARLRTGVSE